MRKMVKDTTNTSTGNKKDNVNVVYTPWSNLKKDGSMAVGQVGFKDQRKVKKILVEARTNAIINRLNKTKSEKFPDLKTEREERDRTIRDREKKLVLERVRFFSRSVNGIDADGEGNRGRRKHELRRSGRRRRGRRIMRMMMCSRRRRWRRIRMIGETRIFTMILCEGIILSFPGLDR